MGKKTSGTSTPRLPPVPSMPRVPTMLDPGVELARLMEQRRLQNSSTGLAGTQLTANLGGVGGSAAKTLMGY